MPMAYFVANFVSRGCYCGTVTLVLMILNNLSYLSPLGSLEHGSLAIKDGKFSSDYSNHTITINLSDHIAIPLLQAKTKEIPANFIENALENGTECIIDPSLESNYSVQFGVWSGSGVKLCQEPIADWIHSKTSHRISVGNPASFVLFKSDSLTDTILKFDYKSSIRAVVKDGIIVMARNELSNYVAKISLSKYYQSFGSQALENVDPNAKYCLDSVIDAIKDIKDGKFVIVVDNLDRENEGDLVIAAQFVTTEKIAFMVKHTGGLLCVSTTPERLEQLQLPLMVENNQDSLRTAYTISLDYKHGTTTGISAFDRATTIREIANLNSSAADFTRPGHVFPLRYVSGGVLRRVGHTEASIDLCKLAGIYPCAAISEVVSVADQGCTMARRDELFQLGKQWGIKMVSISDLVQYKKLNNL